MEQIGDYIVRKENELNRLVDTSKTQKGNLRDKISFANHLRSMRKYVSEPSDGMITVGNLPQAAYQVEEGENEGAWIVNGDDPATKILVEAEERYSLDRPFGAHDVASELIEAMNERRIDSETYTLILKGRLDLAVRRVGIEPDEAWLMYFENNMGMDERLKAS